MFSSAFLSVEREGDEDGSEMPPWDKEKEEEEEEKDRKEKGRLASETGHNDNDRIYAKVDEENHQCFHMKLLNLVHVFLLYVESVGTCCQFHSRRTFFRGILHRYAPSFVSSAAARRLGIDRKEEEKRRIPGDRFGREKWAHPWGHQVIIALSSFFPSFRRQGRKREKKTEKKMSLGFSPFAFFWVTPDFAPARFRATRKNVGNQLWWWGGEEGVSFF